MSKSPQSVLVNNFNSFDAGVANQTNRIFAKMKATKTNECDDHGSIGINHPRTLVFELAGLVGQLSSTFLLKVPLDPPFEALPPASELKNEKSSSAKPDGEEDSPFSISRPHAIEDEEVKRAMGKVLLKLIELGHTLSLKLKTVIVKKMQLNKRKYPADLCRGKAGKYTEYSSITGITKDEGQNTINIESIDEEETLQSFLESLEGLTQDIGDFANERQWTRYHKPRNLVLALLGELGELAEIFQWRGDHAPLESISQEDLDKIGQELADVTIYLIRLSDVSCIDLKAAAQSILDQEAKEEQA